jgi:hypothetical protein
LRFQEAELEKFDGLPKLEAEIEVLESLEESLNFVRSNQIKLHKVIQQIEYIEEEIQNEELVLGADPLIDALIIQINKKRELQFTNLNLKELIKRITIVQQKINESEQLLPAESLINEIDDLIRQRNTVIEKQRMLKLLISKITAIETQIRIAETTYEQLHEEFEVNFPDVCPLCNKPK